MCKPMIPLQTDLSARIEWHNQGLLGFVMVSYSSKITESKKDQTTTLMRCQLDVDSRLKNLQSWTLQIKNWFTSESKLTIYPIILTCHCRCQASPIEWRKRWGHQCMVVSCQVLERKPLQLPSLIWTTPTSRRQRDLTSSNRKHWARAHPPTNRLKAAPRSQFRTTISIQWLTSSSSGTTQLEISRLSRRSPNITLFNLLSSTIKSPILWILCATRFKEQDQIPWATCSRMSIRDPMATWISIRLVMRVTHIITALKSPVAATSCSQLCHSTEVK